MKDLGCFAPTHVDARLSPDGEQLGVRFETEQCCVQLNFHRANVETLFQLLMDEAKIERSKPIQAGQADSLLVPDGNDVRRSPDGDIILTLRVRTDDGRGSMTYPMTPEEARRMAEQLMQYSA